MKNQSPLSKYHRIFNDAYKRQPLTGFMHCMVIGSISGIPLTILGVEAIQNDPGILGADASAERQAHYSEMVGEIAERQERIAKYQTVLSAKEAITEFAGSETAAPQLAETEKNLVAEKAKIVEDIKNLSVSMNLDARLSEPDYHQVYSQFRDAIEDMDKKNYPEGYAFGSVHHQECLLKTKDIAGAQKFEKVMDCKVDSATDRFKASLTTIFGISVGFYLAFPFAHAAVRRRRDEKAIEAPLIEAVAQPVPTPQKRKAPTLDI